MLLEIMCHTVTQLKDINSSLEPLTLHWLGSTLTLHHITLNKNKDWALVHELELLVFWMVSLYIYNYGYGIMM